MSKSDRERFISDFGLSLSLDPGGVNVKISVKVSKSGNFFQRKVFFQKWFFEKMFFSKKKVIFERKSFSREIFFFSREMFLSC